MLCAALALACAGGTVLAGELGAVREVTAHRTAHPPVIDGWLDDEAWAVAAAADSVITAFGSPDGSGPVQDDVTAYVTYGERALYVAVVNASIPGSPVRAEPGLQRSSPRVDFGGVSDGRSGTAPVTRRAVRGQDPLELQVMFDPDHFHAVGGWIWVRSDGRVAQNGFRDPRSIDAASRFTGAGWTVELAIPFLEWGGMPPPGAIWGFDIGGAFGSGGERPTWQPTFGPYAQPGKWGHLRFAGPLTSVSALTQSIRTARAFRVESPPEVDGRLDDAAWETIARSGGVLGGFVRHRGDELAEVPSFAALAYDAENLYVYVRSYRPPGTQLVTRSTEDAGRIWNDDQVELMLAPSESGETGLWIVTNVEGELEVHGQRLWGDSGSIRVRTATDEESWILEMAVPFSVLGGRPGGRPAVPGEVWRFNLGGHRAGTGEWPTWQPTGGPYEWVARWGRLRFVDVSR